MSVARGSSVRSHRLFALAVGVALTLAACTESTEPTPPPTEETVTASPSPTPTESSTTGSPEPPAIAELVVAPGSVGPVTAGMSRDEALATGLFDADVEVGGDECGRVEPLGWKPDYASSLDVLTAQDGTIVSLGARGEEPRTAEGLGVGSTLREVSATYETAEMTEAGYNQTGVFVTDGEQWLGFLFDADLETIKPRTPVLMVEVTNGTRPALMRDGC